MGSKSMSPAVTGAILVVVAAVALVIGFFYLHRGPSDPLADEAARARSRSAATAPGAPVPAKAGASDYAGPAASGK